MSPLNPGSTGGKTGKRIATLISDFTVQDLLDGQGDARAGGEASAYLNVAQIDWVLGAFRLIA